ncbi:uncharacterized protein (TIGR03083 family) [Thermomonospora umbrina]|uniref:Uncharacterized protein (TIGR03083 family) n=2 Tax=Thermomonospora umbrina TaxID=111806 RepID=A0A3D9T081_9ACTN|nr:uncharacterized protein (TIGR03083 family) [Thermomonospora umbrina]
MARNTAAWEQTVRSTIALARDLAPAEHDLPTDCPGWTVKDVLAHIVSVERMLLGEPLPDHPLPEGLAHVRNDFGRLMEIGVDVRRSVPGEKVVAELDEVFHLRLDTLPTIDPAAPTPAPTGEMVPYGMFMAFRAMDCYVHEQDIRRATGRPGNLDAPAAPCARALLLRGLPYVVGKKAAALPGQSVTLEVTGPAAFTVHIEVGPDGRARVTDPLPAPTTTLTMDWETYLVLSAGRRTPDTVTTAITGDPDLATRLLTAMAVTP